MSENQQEKEINLGKKVVGQIELPKIDLTPYIGNKVQITDVKEFAGKHGFYIKIFAECVATIERDGKDDIKLIPSKMFGLHEDEEGQIGWGKDTLLDNYLKKHKVSHYKELVGKEVIVQVKANKQGTEFLDFN